jgi:cytidylate kinase
VISPPLALPATVEERITGWIRIQEAQRRRARPKPPGPTITLSRQFGCEGFPLCLLLKEQLEAASQEPWTIFDRALIERVAADSGLTRQLFSDLGDDTRILEQLGFHPRGALTSSEAFRKVALCIARIARDGHAIIMGRGGAILSAGLANAYHFRLVAGLDWRVASLARRAQLTQAAAAQMVKKQGKLRARFIYDALGADVEDPRYYDALFNNERHPVPVIAAAIVAYISRNEGIDFISNRK